MKVKTLLLKIQIIFLTFFIMFGFTSCTQKTYVSDSQENITLRELAEKKHFYIGSAINSIGLTHPTDPYVEEYKGILANQFNLVVPESNLKMKNCWLSPDEINFDKIDIEAQFAMENNQKMRGHVLLWYRSVPDWLIDGYNSGLYNNKDIENMVRKYFFRVIGHFNANWPELIICWDVVNEAIGPDQPISINGIYGIRSADEDFWVKSLGADYVAKAFTWAHEIDENAILYYNDFKCEFNNPKNDAVYKFVSELVKNGVPIDGIGMQCHFNKNYLNMNYEWADFNIDNISETFDKYAELGLKIAVTEFDFAIYSTNFEDLDKQAEFYYKFTQMALQKKYLACLSLWGFTDRLSWLNTNGKEGMGLIYDKQLQKKKSYIEFRRAFIEWNLILK